MVARAAAPQTASLRVRIFDGHRRPFANPKNIFIRIIDGNQTQHMARAFNASDLTFTDLPLFDNFGDNYTVLISKSGHVSAGFHPVKLSAAVTEILDLMLIPQPCQFDFTDTPFAALQQTRPQFCTIMSGIEANAAAKEASAKEAAAKEAAARELALTKLYRVGPGDVLDVRINDATSPQSTLFTITPAGLLEYPLLAEPMHVGGLSVEEISTNIESDLKRRALMESPKVSVGVRDYASHTILVSGLVLYNWNASFADRFTDVVLLATWMTLIAYAYAAAAELVLFFREPELFSWVKLGRDSVIASLAFAYSVWAIWGSGEEWLAKGFMLLLFGIPVYIWMKWRQTPEPVEIEPNFDRQLLRRTYTPEPRVPAGRN